MSENRSLKKFGYTGKEVIRKRKCGGRCVLSYFGTGEGEGRGETSGNFVTTFSPVTELHGLTLKGWSEKSRNMFTL